MGHYVGVRKDIMAEGRIEGRPQIFRHPKGQTLLDIVDEHFEEGVVIS